MIKKAAVKTDSNGNRYFDALLGDKTGEISSKKWNLQLSDAEELKNYKEGDIVRVKGLVREWQTAKQLNIQRIRRAVTSDGIDEADFIKAAPEPVKEMYRYIYDAAAGFRDDDLKRLCLRVLDDNHEKLLYYPAASRNHHAMFGGLLYHTKKMLMNAIGVCGVYEELDRDLLCAGVILHDIEKIREINADEHGLSSGYSTEGQFLGHLVMGVKYIDSLGRELGVEHEKLLMVEQMIISHHYEPEFGSPVRPLFPEGEVLHYLDILDARLCDMRDVIATLEPGKFSDRIWTLDNRRVYRRLSGEPEPENGPRDVKNNAPSGNVNAGREE